MQYSTVYFFILKTQLGSMLIGKYFFKVCRHTFMSYPNMKIEIFVNIFTKIVLTIRIVHSNYNIKIKTNYLEIKNPVFRCLDLK